MSFASGSSQSFENARLSSNPLEAYPCFPESNFNGTAGQYVYQKYSINAQIIEPYFLKYEFE